MLHALLALTLVLFDHGALVSSQTVSASDLASKLSLTTSTSMPFPTATLTSNATQNLISSKWGTSKGRIQNGATDLLFVDDPFPNSPAPGSSALSGPVLQVTYPAGSFSHDTGGAQFYSLWNTTDGSTFDSVLLTYELAFDSDFDWVLGGKLPGVRGGPDVDGCSGGDPALGENCFSSRVMWRKNAAGEVYAYIPASDDLCTASDILCNQDGYGTSFDRGSFSFAAGQWTTITMLVRLNTPGSSNGQISLYHNNVQALDHQNLIIRTGNEISIGGLYFSTFFGGNDATWETPNTVHTYFRNIQLWGSSASSNGTGKPNSAASLVTGQTCLFLSVVTAVALAMLLTA